MKKNITQKYEYVYYIYYQLSGVGIKSIQWYKKDLIIKTCTQFVYVYNNVSTKVILIRYYINILIKRKYIFIWYL